MFTVTNYLGSGEKISMVVDPNKHDSFKNRKQKRIKDKINQNRTREN